MELERIAAAAARFAAPGEEVAGILAAEPGERVYLCAFESEEGRTWLALDEAGEPVTSRELVRDAASIAALVEVAAEAAGGPPAPRLATTALLDEIGGGLELAGAVAAVEELLAEIEAGYKVELR